MRTFGILCGVLSSAICLVAGLWFEFREPHDSWWIPVGLFFIGMAFYVGPRLVITAMKDK